MTANKLSFDPATQAELNAHAGSAEHDARYFTEAELSTPGSINTAGNPVNWTKLNGVPAGFADGVDDSGGTPADGSITTAKLVDGAVTTSKVADNSLTADDLASGAVTLETSLLIEANFTVTPAQVQRSITLTCPSGWTTVSGGWSGQTGPLGYMFMGASRPSGANSWLFTVVHWSGSENLVVDLMVRCVRPVT